MNRVQLAQARSNSYTLFGRLFLEGITAELLPYVQAVPLLAADLPTPVDLDEAAAEHHTLFSFNVLPYATLFVTADGILGGSVTNQMQQLYRQIGFVPDPATVAADHLGHQLTFLAHLSASEVEAVQNLPSTASIWSKRQAVFLNEHLLPWLLPCLVGVERAGSPFYASVARLTSSLLLSHQNDLAPLDVAARAVKIDSDTPSLSILEDERTSLRDIAHFLMTPCQSGLFLSSQTVGDIARQLELPRGFGNREQIFLNLMRTAVQYEALSLLLTRLNGIINEWEASYAAIVKEFPLADPFLRPWHERLNQTQQLLNRLAHESRTGR